MRRSQEPLAKLREEYRIESRSGCADCIYVPKSGAIVTIGLNSNSAKDGINDRFKAIYATLHQAGPV